MKILYIAEITGKAGLFCAKKTLAMLKEKHQADAMIVCANSATGAGGLGRQHAGYLRKLGADIITLGDFCFYKKDLTAAFDATPYVLRPANLNESVPGSGRRIIRLANGQKLGVAVLLGQAHFTKLHADNPFAAFDKLVEKMRGQTDALIFDFHAIATAEKRSLFFWAAGRCSAVIGSHNRVATADEEVLDGTAVICDTGRTGSQLSVGGWDGQSRVEEYVRGIPDWTKECWDQLETQGVLIDLASDGAARSIVRFREPVTAPPPVAVPPPEAAQ
ncbi:MAG: YmdB family metallophosphoesterase [Spirochaetaceae bacterium]|jgi:metallophosphoesterase (TIGR00282 family)|nr:YmdB family metallophosphoesterase [Spirochaetaceae bacterium]